MKLVRMPIIENKVVGRKVVTKNELRKKVKTNKILIDVNAFSENEVFHKQRQGRGSMSP